jgi:hypothetical protein
MFVRFRESRSRLQVSLVETRRVGGKVQHEHVAGLGSLPLPLTVPGRIDFWARLHARLGQLANRIDATMQGKILGEVHMRVPMVTADEQRALQLENAKQDLGHSSAMRDIHAGQVEGHKGLVAAAERAIRAAEAAAAQASEQAQAAQERIAKIERGEDVAGGLGHPLTREDFDAELIAAGFTRADLRHMETLGALPEEAIPLIRDAALKASARAERSAARALRKKLLAPDSGS